VEPSPSSEACGALLGAKYRLGALLGRGSMGAVYAGRHVRTGRPVAVKILHADYIGNADVASRFLREARLVAELEHPNVVDVLDLDEEPDGTVYMVFELLEGESLASLLRREGALPFERAAELLLPVMRAVAFAHAHGIVHRDLKPENIFLHRDAEGLTVPKVLDFGIAWAPEKDSRPRITHDGFVMGTPQYMSPEQAAGVLERILAPSDVWSMGVLWYEALTGTLPFDGSTIKAMMVAVCHAPFELPSTRLPHLPPAVTAALDRSLLRDVTARHPHMDDFLAALLEAMAPPTADDATDPAPVLLRRRRAGGPRSLVIACVLAACAGMVTARLLRSRNALAVHAAPHAAVLSPAPRPPLRPVVVTAAVRPVTVPIPASPQVQAHGHARRRHRSAGPRGAGAATPTLPRAGGEVMRPNAPITEYDGVR
jgi:serine/threonine-protein kinase